MNDDHPDLAMLKTHANQLAEHFDSVQIFATRHEAGTEDGTVTVNHGTGNWFARYGQIVEWVTKKREEARLSVRGEE
jgi:hypothetical protein